MAAPGIKACCVPSAGRAPRDVPRDLPRPGAMDDGPRVAIPGGACTIGTDAPVFREDGEGPARPVTLKPFLHRRPCRHQPPLRRLRRGDRLPHRCGALRLVLCLPRLRPRRPRRPGPGGHALVAQGGRCLLGGAGGPGSDRRRAPTIRPCMSPGPTPPPSPPGPAGACRPRRNGNTRPGAAPPPPAFPGATTSRRQQRRPLQHLAGRLSAPEHRRRRLRRHRAGGRLPPQRLRPVQHVRQCLGMVRGRLPRALAVGGREARNRPRRRRRNA